MVLTASQSGEAFAQNTDSTTSGSATVVGPGHSAYWFNPDRSGEGLALEILDASRALLYWFTYDEVGGQRWMLATGVIQEGPEGRWIDFPDLFVYRGGTFGTGFDPETIEPERVGQATLAFSDCDSGQFYFQAFGQEAELEVVRLSRTMGADCTQPIHGRTLFPQTEDARVSGSWYDPERDGEGFSLQWLDRDEALMTWYTYDLEGNQQWIIGVGSREGDQVVFRELTNSRGGQFGAAFDPEDVELVPWGAVTMSLDCDSGLMSYASMLPEFGEGEFPLQRLTRLQKPGCVIQKPTLLDLYDFELVTEVPIDGTGFSRTIRPTRISDDGAVVLGTYLSQGHPHNWRWEPGMEELEVLPGEGRFNEAVMTPDGDTVYSTLGVVPENVDGSEDQLYSWNESIGWNSLPGTNLLRPALWNISNNGKYLAGSGHRNVDDPLRAIWIWHELGGQRVMAHEEDLNFVFNLRGVADGGRSVVGIATDAPDEISAPQRDRAVRLVGDRPEFLVDDEGNSLLVPYGCAVDCRIVFGGGQSIESDPLGAGYREAWVWSESKGVEYVGRFPDASSRQSFDAFLQGSSDGNLLTGDYAIDLPDGGFHSRGFIWTRATGLQPLSELLRDLEIEDSHWEVTGVVDVNQDGLLWLVYLRPDAGEAPFIGGPWAGILRLTPRITPYQ